MKVQLENQRWGRGEFPLQGNWKWWIHKCIIPIWMRGRKIVLWMRQKVTDNQWRWVTWTWEWESWRSIGGMYSAKEASHECNYAASIKTLARRIMPDIYIKASNFDAVMWERFMVQPAIYTKAELLHGGQVISSYYCKWHPRDCILKQLCISTKDGRTMHMGSDAHNLLYIGVINEELLSMQFKCKSEG